MDGLAQEALLMSALYVETELLKLEKAVMMEFLITKAVRMIVWE